MCDPSSFVGVDPTKAGQNPSWLQNHGCESIHIPPRDLERFCSSSAIDSHWLVTWPMQSAGPLDRVP